MPTQPQLSPNPQFTPTHTLMSSFTTTTTIAPNSDNDPPPENGLWTCCLCDDVNFLYTDDCKTCSRPRCAKCVIDIDDGLMCPPG